ncbi:MAG: glycosyltransferase family 39 protein [Candidatus Sumerlaeota bacterium]|nr:glycosyltransferase family 39 protein [Candidatus Sumerlaeota bacterium]
MASKPMTDFAKPEVEAPSPPLWILAVVGIAVFIYRLFVASSIGLFPDEFVYVWIGKNSLLTASPHPPGAAFLTRLGIGLLGHSELGARFFSAVLVTLAIIPVYLLARQTGGRAAGFWAAFIFLLTPLYLYLGAVIPPDGPQVFFWAALLYMTYQALETRKIGWWLLAGLTAGLGLFVKYVVILYFPCLFLCLILAPDWRSQLRSPGLWASIGLTILLFVPFNVWREYQMDWNAIRYHLSQRHAYRPPTWSGVGRYYGYHAAFLSPLLYAGTLAAMVWSGIAGWRRRDRRLIFLFSFSSVVFLVFTVIVAVTAPMTSQEHWDAPAYMAAIIALVIWFRERLAAANAQRRRLLMAAGALTAGLMLLVNAGVVLEGLLALPTRLAGKGPAVISMLGYAPMGPETDRRFAVLPDAGNAFIIGNTFEEVFPLSFYARVPKRYYTFRDSHDNRWGLRGMMERWGIFIDNIEKEIGHNALYVVDQPLEPRERFTRQLESRLELLRAAFAEVKEEEPIIARQWGRDLRMFRIFRCLDLRRAVSFPARYSNRS